jgi:hypothetical protein
MKVDIHLHADQQRPGIGTNTSVTLKSLRLREPGLDPRPRYAFFAMPSALSQSGG